MPGFWGTMKRLIAGEPVYQVSDQKDDSQTKAAQPAGSSDEAEGQKESLPTKPVPPVLPKIYPEVVIVRTECQAQDYDMEVTVHVRNNSLEHVTLSEIALMEREDKLEEDLNPGDTREFTAYKGPVPTNTYATRCELRYRNATGDYFAARHNVEFEQADEGRYWVKRIKFVPPIKDI